MSDMKVLGQRRMAQAIQRRESLQAVMDDLLAAMSPEAFGGAQEMAIWMIRECQKEGFKFKTPDATSAGIINGDPGAQLRWAGEQAEGKRDISNKLLFTSIDLALLAAPHVNLAIKYVWQEPRIEKRAEDQPLAVRIVGMPDREELTSIERDEAMEITKTTRISKDLRNA